MEWNIVCRMKETKQKKCRTHIPWAIAAFETSTYADDGIKLGGGPFASQIN